MIAHQFGVAGDEVESDFLREAVLTVKCSPAVQLFGVLASECFGAVAEAISTFEGDIDDRPFRDGSSSIWPAKRDMHHEVENEEAFGCLRRSPYCDDTVLGNHAVD